MRYIPKPHQVRAAEFLRRHDRCALFLDMGLGKTVITLTYIAELLDDMAINAALVIAPLNVAKYTWATEADKWDHTAHLRVIPVLGSATERRRKLQTPADVYVINRENVQWLVEECLAERRWPFDMVVLDELSSFKSSSSKRFRTLRKVISKSRYVVGLTGTPAGNGYLDLWPEMYLIDQGQHLGRTLTAYRDAFFTPGAHKGRVVYDWRMKNGAKDEIDRRLRDVCLSMSKDDWLSMPPINVSDVTVSMDVKEREVYRRMQTEHILPLLNGDVTKRIDDADGAIVAPMAATLSGKLRQLANGFAYTDDGDTELVRFSRSKADMLAEIIEAAQGQPVLVFFLFKADRDLLTQTLPQAEELNDDSIGRWNRGEVPVLLCHPASAGHGLNLQSGGHIIVWFGLPWSLELYQQANARLYRQGQEQPVQVYRLLCGGTIDERVAAALDDKDSTQRSLLDALKEEVKEMTNNG